MMDYILIAFMIFLILIKIIAMIKVSKGDFSSTIVRYWTIAPVELENFKELSKEKQTKLKLYVYLSSSLDILVAGITIIVTPWAETGLFLILALILSLNPILFSSYMNRK